MTAGRYSAAAGALRSVPKSISVGSAFGARSRTKICMTISSTHSARKNALIGCVDEHR